MYIDIMLILCFWLCFYFMMKIFGKRNIKILVYIVKDLFSINYVYSLKMWWVEILFSVILKILEC